MKYLWTMTQWVNFVDPSQLPLILAKVNYGIQVGNQGIFVIHSLDVNSFWHIVDLNQVTDLSQKEILINLSNLMDEHCRHFGLPPKQISIADITSYLQESSWLKSKIGSIIANGGHNPFKL